MSKSKKTRNPPRKQIGKTKPKKLHSLKSSKTSNLLLDLYDLDVLLNLDDLDDIDSLDNLDDFDLPILDLKLNGVELFL